MNQKREGFDRNEFGVPGKFLIHCDKSNLAAMATAQMKVNVRALDTLAFGMCCIRAASSYHRDDSTFGKSRRPSRNLDIVLGISDPEDIPAFGDVRRVLPKSLGQDLQICDPATTGAALRPNCLSTQTRFVFAGPFWGRIGIVSIVPAI